MDIETFDPEDRFTWSYNDEQCVKAEWKEADGSNPYAGMPRLRFDVYTLGEEIALEVAGTAPWTIDRFFEVGRDDRFVNETAVLRWLELIQQKGTGRERTYPYEERPLGVDGVVDTAARHSVWVFSRVAACDAMKALLDREAPGVFAGTEVINVGGNAAGEGRGRDPEKRVKAAARMHERTLTLTCGRLLTGVTIPEWGLIGMLYDGESATKYLQAAFRVQSEWRENGRVRKPTAYVFDIDPNRAVNVMSEYAEQAADGPSVEDLQNGAEKLTQHLDFIWHEGGDRTRLEAGEIVRLATEGVGTRMLARRWNDHRTIRPEALTPDGFLRTNPELLDVIDRIHVHADPAATGHLNRAVLTSNPDLAGDGAKPPSNRERKKSERARDAEREKLKKKLLALVKRIPRFMYLTEDREKSLKEVMRGMDAESFEEVTGITLDEFQRILDSGALNDRMLDRSVLSFRYAETESLGYLGVEPPWAEQTGGSNA